MAGYKPLRIAANASGLIQNREEFLLPNDAYPVLNNAYVWRERILRKKGYELLGRLQRNFTALNFAPTPNFVNNVFTQNFLRISGYVVAADNGNPGKVTTSAPHNLVTGNQVNFTGVMGAVGYNNSRFTITTVLGDPYSFTIGANAGGFGMYTGGGIFESSRALSNIEPNAALVPGSVIYTVLATPTPVIYTDNGLGTLVSNTSGTTGSVNYNTGIFQISYSSSPPFPGNTNTTLTYSYYPNLPVMGIRTEEAQNSAIDVTIFFDQKYAYIYNSSTNLFQEFIPGTVWNLHGAGTDGVDFFWSTNYWVSAVLISGTMTPFFTTANRKLFWETNNTGIFANLADPPRITDGTTWYPFYNDANQTLTPWAQLDATTWLVNYLCNLPYRGRMVVFNTWEGINATSASNFTNRIRWATIGNPFLPYTAGPPARGSWRDDIRGQGGFLDIPTSEDIVGIGFVRDNLVIYCERSTWQLRYTGRSIAPFQIERVNSELGAESTFAPIQFDTSLVGVGDKGIVECDSYKSNRIDVKIPDFVFQITSLNNGLDRCQGIRDFENRLAFWTVPLQNVFDPKVKPVFPNTRLVYNYENDSWALFNDSLTALGNFQPPNSRTWLNTHLPWIKCKFSWISQTASELPSIVGGNQQGFVEYLDETDSNDVSLYIKDIIANSPPTVPSNPPAQPNVISAIFIVPDHNMSTGFVIETSGFTGFYNSVGKLNGIFGIVVIDSNSFSINSYDPASDQFSKPYGPLYIADIVNITVGPNPTVTIALPNIFPTGALLTLNNMVGSMGAILNGNTYSITEIDSLNFSLNGVDTTGSDYVSGGTIQLPYPGGALLAIRENFSVKSKKFNFLDKGQNIQLGFLDVLLQATGADNPGEIAINIYTDYDDINVTNTQPQNNNHDTFFNTIIPTIPSTLNTTRGTKFWQRVICPTRANFITIEYTFNNEQMNSVAQQLPVQIDAQVLWLRTAGRMTQI